MLKQILLKIYNSFTSNDAPYEHLGHIALASHPQVETKKNFTPLYTTGLFSTNMIETASDSNSDVDTVIMSPESPTTIESEYSSDSKTILQGVVDLIDESPEVSEISNKQSEIQEEENVIFADDIFGKKNEAKSEEKNKDSEPELYEPAIDWESTLTEDEEVKELKSDILDPLVTKPLPSKLEKIKKDKSKKLDKKKKKKTKGKKDQKKKESKKEKKKASKIISIKSSEVSDRTKQARIKKKKSKSKKKVNRLKKNSNTFLRTDENIHDSFTSWLLDLDPLQEEVQAIANATSVTKKKKKKKHKKVLESAKKSITLSDEIATESLAQIYISQGHYEKANQILDKLIELQPENMAKFELIKASILGK